MTEIARRLSPAPSPYIDHPLLGRWFAQAKGRQRGSARSQQAAAGTAAGKTRRSAAALLRAVYGLVFGSPPQVGGLHPLWIDLAPMMRKVSEFRKSAKNNILWIGSEGFLLDQLVDPPVSPIHLVRDHQGSFFKEAPYDACFCQLTLRDLPNLDHLYAKIRSLMKNDARVVIYVIKMADMFEGIELIIDPINFPDIDVSEINFNGTHATSLMRQPFLRAGQSFSTRPFVRRLFVGLCLILMAPFVGLANVSARRRDLTIFSPAWTSLIIELRVKRATPPGT